VAFYLKTSKDLITISEALYYPTDSTETKKINIIIINNFLIVFFKLKKFE
jgi:hypothetical protein